MAIPDSPNWSSLTDVKAYPTPDFEKPDPITGITSTSLGPFNLNDSKGKLNTRYWMVYKQLANVVIVGSVNGEWGSPTILFEELTPITDISLTFDQLGRPIVFYKTQDENLKLYWYDPIIQENTITNLTTGQNPLAGFDFPQDTGQSFTDILLFYVRNNTVYMRIQRDRFSIEYGTGVTQDGVRLLSCGLRVDNRFQLVYDYPDYSDGVEDIEVVLPPIG